uniref:Ulp1 protease family, C-terminal catalytic domain containing protein n=1 Tax=Solanum tuberosum TaxID=4113 RepID=M1DFZ7_SOLTU
MIHVNGTTLRFTIRDFAIISGLKCSDNENDFVFNTEEPNRIILQYFGVEKSITKKQLVDNFSNKVWGDVAVKFAILFYIHSFILYEEPTITVIDRKDFDLVKSGRYIDYPWDKTAFDLLILHLHNKIKHDGKYYRLYGFPLALQTKKDFPRLQYFAKGMFRDDNNPLVFHNLSQTPIELKTLELPLEYVQSDQSPTEISATNDSDDDFQDPPHPKNNKGKEKVDTCSSPPKKKSRQTITPIQKKTPPRVISKQPCLRKSLRHANVPKRPRSPLPKRQAKQCANVASYPGNKKNVEIKSSAVSEIPSTSKSHDFSISRDEFDQFKISGDGVEVTHKVPTVSVDQSEEPSRHSPSELNCQSVYNDLNDQEDLLNVIYDQTEKMEKEEFTETNKPGSSDANKLVVEEVFMCPAPLQMVHDDQSNPNPERSRVLHPLLVVDEHTPLPIPRERRPSPINISPYVTSFGSESGSSSRFTFTFDLKHLFVSMSDVDLTTLYMHFWK